MKLVLLLAFVASVFASDVTYKEIDEIITDPATDVPKFTVEALKILVRLSDEARNSTRAAQEQVEAIIGGLSPLERSVKQCSNSNGASQQADWKHYLNLVFEKCVPKNEAPKNCKDDGNNVVQPAGGYVLPQRRGPLDGFFTIDITKEGRDFVIVPSVRNQAEKYAQAPPSIEQPTGPSQPIFPNPPQTQNPDKTQTPSNQGAYPLPYQFFTRK